MFNDIQAVILAAGKSTRFNTGKTKLIEKVCGQELIIYPLNVLQKFNIPTTVVIGYEKELVKETIKKHFDSITFIEQPEQLGTGHATRMTRNVWNKKYVLLMKGDVPLITPQTIEGLFNHHQETNATITFVTAHNSNPTSFSYGRVVKKDNKVNIVRPHEINKNELQDYCCINGGIVLINREFLESAIDTLTQREFTKEYHMSDLINLATDQNKTVSTFNVPFDYVRGINNFQELWAAEHIKRSELIKHWMERGVRFSTAQSVHMDLDVEIGAGTFIGCGVHLLAGTKIGTNCEINSTAMIENSTLGNNVKVYAHTIIRDTTVHDFAEIGPFAHIQEGTVIGEYAQVGNFVEAKRTTIGAYSKAKHLTYLGDAQIGSNVNIGAGTITCNYSGKKKHTTVIKDYAFIGTNNSLVAPVTIHERAFTAAGSTITKDVPEDALGIGRSKQVNKEGYAKKLRSKQEQFSFVGAVKTTNETPHEV